MRFNPVYKAYKEYEVCCNWSQVLFFKFDDLDDFCGLGVRKDLDGSVVPASSKLVGS